MITQIVFDDGGTDHQVHSAFRNRKFAAADSETGSGASRKTRDHAKPKIAHSKSDFLRNVFPAGFAPPPDVRAPPPLKYNGPSKHAERPSSSSHSREYVAVVTKSSRRPTGLQPMRSTPRFDFGPPLLEMRDSPPSTQGFDPSTGIGGLDELRYVAGPFFRVPEEGASGQVKTAVVRLDASETIDAEIAAEPSGAFPKLNPMPPLRGQRGATNSVAPPPSSHPQVHVALSGPRSPSSVGNSKKSFSPSSTDAHHGNASAQSPPQHYPLGVKFSSQAEEYREASEGRLLREILCGQERALELHVEFIHYEHFVGGKDASDANISSTQVTIPYRASFLEVQELAAKSILADPLSRVMRGNFKVELKFFKEATKVWLPIADEIHWIHAKSTALDHENNQLRLLCRAINDNSHRRSSCNAEDVRDSFDSDGLDALLTGVRCAALNAAAVSDAHGGGLPMPAPSPQIGLSDDDVSLNSAYSMNSRTMQNFQRSYNDSFSFTSERTKADASPFHRGSDRGGGRIGRGGGPDVEKLGAWADNLQRRISRTTAK